jgi:hypothetical protein
MKIRSLGAELFHADRHDEANSRFRNFANPPKNQSINDIQEIIAVTPESHETCYKFSEKR